MAEPTTPPLAGLLNVQSAPALAEMKTASPPCTRAASLFPSAEQASDTQLAEGAVVTVQFWATDGSVGSGNQMQAANIPNTPQSLVSPLLTATAMVCRFIAITPVTGARSICPGNRTHVRREGCGCFLKPTALGR